MTASNANWRIVFSGRGVAQVEECPMPTPGADQLLIRTCTSLISPGTERAFFLGMPNTPQQYPNYPGYSNIGEVIIAGDGVTGWTPGMTVASAAGHAAYVLARAGACVPVPRDLPDEEAAFFNLSAIAMQGVRKARIELGEPMAVVGAGLIGLLAMQLAKLNGALPAITVDTDERRLGFAQAVHADATVKADEHLSTTIARLCEDEGAAVVIEATGHPEAILTAFALARPGGRVVLLGSTRGETEQVNFYRDVHKKGLTIIGAHNMARPKVESHPGWWIAEDDQRVALKLLASGRLKVQPLITHRFAWRQAPQAYERLKQWDTGTLGMVLDWYMQ
jgi:2-desacetyl-2-hydroxyethyl bacteriochlorophyllide A dehydrogenase